MDRSQDNRTRRARRQRGVSLAELLAVLALIGLVIAVGVPIVSEQVRQGKIRGAADQYAMTLKAARMLAVSKRAAQSVTVSVNPTNSYSYVNTRDETVSIAMPEGVRIASSTNPITFQINGSIAAAATTVIEADLNAGVTERWTVSTGIGGVPTVTRERIEP